MPRLNGIITAADIRAPFGAYYQYAEQRIEAAALRVTQVGSKRALREIRSQMSSASLGRLGNGLGSNSDLEKGRTVHRNAQGGFSATGTVFIRSQSPRSRGTIESYTGGSEIVPVRGRWLWIATDQIPRITGRYRMTPELYVRNGFEQKIGPLVQIRGPKSHPLLVVKNVGVAMGGAARSAKSLKKNGMPRVGQMVQDTIVAFFAIPRTSRTARVDVHAIMTEAANRLPAEFNREMGAT